MKNRLILLIDAAINYALGALLLLFCPAIYNFLGVPGAESYFYPNILGAVLFGIGIALTVEALKKDKGITGLGLAGAVSINLCGGAVLAFWLIKGLAVPLKGQVFLWALVIILVGISTVELIAHLKYK